MIPFAGDTATLFRLAEGRAERILMRGCSWRRVRARSMEDGEMRYGEESCCRIPAEYPPPRAGDVLMRGEVEGAFANRIELIRLMEAHRSRGGAAFIVERVSDNARPGTPIPHYAARGRD